MKSDVGRADPHGESFGCWSAALLAVIVVSLVIFEIISMYGVERTSRVQRRFTAEYADALGLKSPPDGAVKGVLVVGNSLLITDVDFPSLRSALSPDFDVRRLAVEATAYHDWYYGLRALFYRGARPYAVVLMLTTDQLVASGVRGEYFALRLMRIGDLPSVARELKLHPTVTASLLLAGVSHYYGLISEVRKWVLSEILPGLPEMTSLLTPSSRTVLSDADFFAVAGARLRTLHALARQHNARLIVVVPPIRRVVHSMLLERAGSEAGVPVLVGYEPAIYSSRDYADGFHLNESGAATYTARLIPALRRLLSEE